IEDVLAGMPGVLEVAAVGVPDQKSGETVKVVIVRKDPNLTAEDVKAFAREQLTGYKRPHIIEFRNELPKTNVGKILRRALRDDAAVGCHLARVTPSRTHPCSLRPGPRSCPGQGSAAGPWSRT